MWQKLALCAGQHRVRNVVIWGFSMKSGWSVFSNHMFDLKKWLIYEFMTAFEGHTILLNLSIEFFYSRASLCCLLTKPMNVESDWHVIVLYNKRRASLDTSAAPWGMKRCSPCSHCFIICIRFCPFRPASLLQCESVFRPVKPEVVSMPALSFNHAGVYIRHAVTRTLNRY